MSHSPDRSRVASLASRYDDASLTVPLETAGFWAAVALPAAYLPLLTSGARGSLAFALVAAHVVALAVGHTHGD